MKFANLLNSVRPSVAPNFAKIDYMVDMISIMQYVLYFDKLPDVVVHHVREAGTRTYLPQFYNQTAVNDIGGSHDYHNVPSANTFVYVLNGFEYKTAYFAPIKTYWESDIRTYIESMENPTLSEDETKILREIFPEAFYE